MKKEAREKTVLHKWRAAERAFDAGRVNDAIRMCAALLRRGFYASRNVHCVRVLARLQPLLTQRNWQLGDEWLLPAWRFVRARARAIYIREGGDAAANWLRAEHELIVEAAVSRCLPFPIWVTKYDAARRLGAQATEYDAVCRLSADRETLQEIAKGMKCHQ